MRRSLRLGSIVFACVFGFASAGAADLGDPAGALEIAEWVKGSPVTIAPGDTTYVVEFWATWCPPCRASIPHLTELQKTFKDKGVVFIGVTAEESDVVKPFVAEMADKMDYVVAVDKSRATSKRYMTAYGQDGIPTAFVVDTSGRVAWVGHPMNGLDLALEQITSGTYNVETAKKQAMLAKESEKLFEQFAKAVDSGDKAKVDALAEEVLTKYAELPRLLNEISWTLLTHDEKLIHNYPLGLRLAKAAVDGTKSKDASILDTYARALFETGDVKGAIEQQQKAIALVTNEEFLAQLKEPLARYQAAAK